MSCTGSELPRLNPVPKPDTGVGAQGSPTQAPRRAGFSHLKLGCRTHCAHHPGHTWQKPRVAWKCVD